MTGKSNKMNTAQIWVFIISFLVMMGACVHMMIYTKYHYIPLVKSIKNLNDFAPAWKQFAFIRNIDFGIVIGTCIVGLFLLLALRSKEEPKEEKK